MRQSGFSWVGRKHFLNFSLWWRPYFFMGFRIRNCWFTIKRAKRALFSERNGYTPCISFLGLLFSKRDMPYRVIKCPHLERNPPTTLS